MFYLIIALLLSIFTAPFTFSDDTVPVEQYARIGRFDTEETFDVNLCSKVIKNAPAAIQQLIANIKQPSRNKRIVPQRLLLLGPPGVGKTTLAKSIAKAIDRHYYFIEAPFLLNEYKNSGIQNLAREIQPILQSGEPCVIIIDEITELTDQYDKEKSDNRNVAAALWLILDQCAAHPDILFIGTTNKNEHDLPAQIKSRFAEDMVYIDPPNKTERAKILRYYLQFDQHTIDERYFNYLVKKTAGKSARDIEKLFIKAAQHANMRMPGTYEISAIDFDAVIKQWQSPYHPKLLYKNIKPYLLPFNEQALPLLNYLVNIASLGVSLYSLHQSNPAAVPPA